MSTMRFDWRLAAIVAGTALLVTSVLLIALGYSPWSIYSQLLERTWLDDYGRGQVLFKATPLIMTGLAVAIPYRAGLFNIGVEGQVVAGCFVTAVVASAIGPGLSGWLALPLVVLVAAAVGAVIAMVPALLRVYAGAHEVVTTLMLNGIIVAIVLWLGRTYFFVPGTTHTPAVGETMQIAKLGVGGSAVNGSLFVALLLAAGCYFVIMRTRVGFVVRAVGANAKAARAAGMNHKRVLVGTMLAGGALAGLVACNYVLGYKHYYEHELGAGVGFLGIAVAFLVACRPLWIIPSALLFATLEQGGVSLGALVPREVFRIVEAVIILLFIAGQGARERGEGGAHV